jgi:hypothetical protein
LLVALPLPGRFGAGEVAGSELPEQAINTTEISALRMASV